MLEKIEKSIFLTKPIIGIVGRYEKNYIKVNESVKDAVTKCGGIPILIIPTQIKYDKELSNEEKKDLINQILLCDGIISPGGSNEYPYDKFICEYCKENSIPMLGICLGMQIMASYKNLETTKNNHCFQNLKYAHKIFINKDTILKYILGNETYVNSRHKCKIKDVKNYIISAISDDGVIEAIEDDNSIGVQWHPEDMIEYDTKQKNLIKYFINICKK